MMSRLKPLEILRDPGVRRALAEAWVASLPGQPGGHEEGGFIVLEGENNCAVRRWPTGAGNLIKVPDHPRCQVDGKPLLATFHTHPNLGEDFLQEPSETDKRGVRDDAELKGDLYVGEFVIAGEMVYLITSSGTVRELGTRAELLG
jgi:hypothetical protein